MGAALGEAAALFDDCVGVLEEFGKRNANASVAARRAFMDCLGADQLSARGPEVDSTTEAATSSARWKWRGRMRPGKTNARFH